MTEKRVLVTGAAGGVGRAVADLIVQAGASVLMTDRPGSDVSHVADGLKNVEGQLVKSIEVDLADSSAGKTFMTASKNELGGIDAVVNAGAVLRRSAFLDVSEQRLEESINVNLRSMFLVCQAVAREMSENNGGAIVNFASPSAFTGGKVGAIHYGMAKAGVISLTRGIATEFGAQGIRANVLCPGTTDTKMIRETLTGEQIEQHLGGNPMGRLARPEEIAGGVVFLLSHLANFVNGVVLTVDGGGSLRP